MKSHFGSGFSSLVWSALGLFTFLSPQEAFSVQIVKPIGTPLTNRPKIEIGAAETYVKGFPAVIKLRTQGPLHFSRFSLFSPVGNFQILLTSKQDGRVFSMYPISTAGSNRVYGNSNGEILSGDFFQRSPSVDLPDSNSSHVDLLDLSSIKNEGINFDEMSAGAYELQVILNQRRIRSPIVNILVKDASTEEIKYLNIIRSRWLNQLPEITKRVYEVMPFRDWNEVLIKRISLDYSQDTKISQDAKKSLFLFKIYSSIISNEGDSKVFEKLKDFRGVALSYLNDVFSSLFLETRLLRNKAGVKDEEIERFVADNPGLEWRIREAQAGQTEFSVYLTKVKALP